MDAARSIKDNAQAAISSYLRVAFYGKQHPYGNPPDEMTLARIQRRDILEFYSRIYRGRNLIFVVTGDFDPAQAKPKLAPGVRKSSTGHGLHWGGRPSVDSGMRGLFCWISPTRRRLTSRSPSRESTVRIRTGSSWIWSTRYSADASLPC